jgi:AbrB family looped-hinge helix DNA binding protein
MTVRQSRVTAQGQISVPAEIRRKLGIGPGSVLEWEEAGDRVLVRKAGRFSSEEIHRAVFRGKPATRSLKAFDEGIRKHVKSKHAGR